MKNNFKKVVISSYLALALFGIFVPSHFASAEQPQPIKYNLLTPIPCDSKTAGSDCVGGKLSTFNTDSSKSTEALGKYLNIIIRLFIGFCAVLAVIMIVIGGVEYMTSELISGKEAGKDRIREALLGLLLALGAYTLLNTINPDLLNTKVDIAGTQLSVEIRDVDIWPENLDPAVQYRSIGRGDLTNLGIQCNGGGPTALPAIAQSFIGHSSYDQNRRNTVSGGIAYIDCSSFVSQVYICAGLPNPGGTTVGIFNRSERVTSRNADGTIINGIPLKVGDLLGHPDPDGNGPNPGHVVMYIGNGQIIDTLGATKGVAVRPLRAYLSRITSIKRLP